MSGKAIIPTLAVLAVSFLSTSTALGATHSSRLAASEPIHGGTLGPTTLRDSENHLGCAPGELINGYHQNCTTMPTGAGGWGWALGVDRYGNKWSPAAGVTVEEGQEAELISYHEGATINIECRTWPTLATFVNGHARIPIPAFRPCYATGNIFSSPVDEAPNLNGSDFALPETPHGFNELVIG